VARRKSSHVAVDYKGTGGAGPAISRVLVVVTCIAGVAALIPGFELGPSPTIGSAAEPGGMYIQPSTSSSSEVAGSGLVQPVSTASAAHTATPSAPHIGIVSGHWGHDDGASCPDGLTEAEVNLDVARRVVSSLRDLGYRVDLLEEFDPRLENYQADALVSVHADSCQQFPDASPPPTGFKVASVVDSAVPEEEDRLVACITERYGERTGLDFHANSITGHMTQYHTFYEIHAQTPGAIIETGFLWLDRVLLTEHPDLVAQGIVDGIVCFLEE